MTLSGILSEKQRKNLEWDGSKVTGRDELEEDYLNSVLVFLNACLCLINVTSLSPSQF